MLTEFVPQAARASATDTLAERDHVVLDPETWDRLDVRVAERGKRSAKVAVLCTRPTSSQD
ncbi:MAG: type II toxin-antitoxin system TacA family antitoxin [Acidimicrobiales bacterium]